MFFPAITDFVIVAIHPLAALSSAVARGTPPGPSTAPRTAPTISTAANCIVATTRPTIAATGRSALGGRVGVRVCGFDELAEGIFGFVSRVGIDVPVLHLGCCGLRAVRIAFLRLGHNLLIRDLPLIIAAEDDPEDYPDQN